LAALIERATSACVNFAGVRLKIPSIFRAGRMPCAAGRPCGSLGL
jgi:hypothetical protein